MIPSGLDSNRIETRFQNKTIFNFTPKDENCPWNVKMILTDNAISLVPHVSLLSAVSGRTNRVLPVEQPAVSVSRTFPTHSAFNSDTITQIILFFFLYVICQIANLPKLYVMVKWMPNESVSAYFWIVMKGILHILMYKCIKVFSKFKICQICQIWQIICDRKVDCTSLILVLLHIQVIDFTYISKFYWCK